FVSVPQVEQGAGEVDAEAAQRLEGPAERHVFAAPADEAGVDPADGAPGVAGEDGDAPAGDAGVGRPAGVAPLRFGAGVDGGGVGFGEAEHGAVGHDPAGAGADDPDGLGENVGGDDAVGVGDDEDVVGCPADGFSECRAFRPVPEAVAFDDLPPGVVACVPIEDVAAGCL